MTTTLAQEEVLLCAQDIYARLMGGGPRKIHYHVFEPPVFGSFDGTVARAFGYAPQHTQLVLEAITSLEEQNAVFVEIVDEEVLGDGSGSQGQPYPIKKLHCVAQLS